MIYVNVLTAANLWWRERKDEGAHHFILRNIPFLFEVIEALHLEIKKLPLHSQKGVPNQEIDKHYVLTIGMFLPASDYGALRTILSLTGDIYNLTTPLLRPKDGSLMELQLPIQRLFNCADNFRNARNFFTHLDEVITNMDKHGITGPATTNCGITYKENAKGCVHLIWDGINTIHFTWRNKVEQITIETSTFNPVFDIARELYSELISHKIHTEDKDYIQPESLFPP
jgi:hypothetical protein